MFFTNSKEPSSFRRIPLDVKGRLYVSPMPYGPYDPKNSVFRMYRRKRVERVVMLLFDEEIKKKCRRGIRQIYERNNIRITQCAFKDLTAPLHETINYLVKELAAGLEAGERMAVHCNAGVGRTGIVTCCLVRIIKDFDGDTAIDYVKEHMLIDMTDEQQRFIRKWELSLPPTRSGPE